VYLLNEVSFTVGDEDWENGKQFIVIGLQTICVYTKRSLLKYPNMVVRKRPAVVACTQKRKTSYCILKKVREKLFHVLM